MFSMNAGVDSAGVQAVGYGEEFPFDSGHEFSNCLALRDDEGQTVRCLPFFVRE